MAVDFPNSPTVGQEFTNPNGVVYTWDGVKWVSGPCGASGGGMTQTPWLSNINANNFNLDSVRKLGVNMLSPSQPQYTFGVHATMNQNFYVGTTSGGVALTVIDDAVTNVQSIVFNAVDFRFNGLFGAQRMLINSSGNIGIALSNPAYLLDVNGDINISGAFRINGVPLSTGQDFWQGGSGGSIYYSGGFVGIETTTPECPMDVNGIIRTTSATHNITNGSGVVMYLVPGSNGVVQAYDWDIPGPMPLNVVGNPTYLNGGNVGINTTTPAYQLDVNGTSAANLFRGKGTSGAAIISAASGGNNPRYEMPASSAFAVIVDGPNGVMRFVVSDNFGTTYTSNSMVINPD